MTLRDFLTVTAEISDRDLRPALALALKKEVPRSQQSYARFYHRVLDELAVCGEARPSGVLGSQQTTNGRVSSAAPGWLGGTREQSHQDLQGFFTQ
ncbi:MAG: hypothetical protein O7E49_10305 [Gemmatimonadetes bacterium]|nr:hypothetical protein [Gemmatimonadota bacterium]